MTRSSSCRLARLSTVTPSKLQYFLIMPYNKTYRIFDRLDSFSTRWDYTSKLLVLFSPTTLTYSTVPPPLSTIALSLLPIPQHNPTEIPTDVFLLRISWLAAILKTMDTTTTMLNSTTVIPMTTRTVSTTTTLIPLQPLISIP